MKSQLKLRLAALVADDRSFKRRLLLAAVAGFSLTFTFLFFGVVDLFVSNRQALLFYLDEFIWPLIALDVVCFAVLTAIFFLFRGKLLDIVISLAVGVLAAGYLQGNFLNLNLGQLTGDTIPWHEFSIHAFINLFIWLLICLAPLVVRYFSRPAWTKLVIFVPAVIVVVQVAALIFMMATSGVLDEKRDGRFLSRDGIYELSANENVVVFVVDRLDTVYVDAIEKISPGFFEPLDGFTYFADNTALYARTFPSTAFMFTGAAYDFQTDRDEYFDQVWSETTFIPDFRAAGYNTRLYTPACEFTRFEQVEGLVDNISSDPLHLDQGKTIAQLIKFTAYRYAPHALKPSFWMTTYDFDDVLSGTWDARPYTEDDYLFYNELVETGLSLQSEENAFSVYHLLGSHPPYVINEEVDLLPESAGDAIRQTKGCFRILYEYMRQMKELGIYDDATIVITGDHGVSEDFFNLDRAKTTAMFVKPKGSASTPLQVSMAPVSHDNFQATLLQSAGLSTEGYGTSAFDVPEDAIVTRRFYYRVSSPVSLKGHLEVFEITGPARDFSNWRKLEELPVIYYYL